MHTPCHSLYAIGRYQPTLCNYCTVIRHFLHSDNNVAVKKFDYFLLPNYSPLTLHYTTICSLYLKPIHPCELGELVWAIRLFDYKRSTLLSVLYKYMYILLIKE